MLNCITFLSKGESRRFAGLLSLVPGAVSTANRREPFDLRQRTARSRWPEEVVRDERSGSGAEAGPRPRARTDVEDTVDRCAMSRLRRKRPPEEVLVERERPAVRIAVCEVRIRRLEIGRGEDDPRADRALELRDVRRDPRLDAIRVPLAQLRRPPSVAGVDLSG